MGSGPQDPSDSDSARSSSSEEYTSARSTKFLHKTYPDSSASESEYPSQPPRNHSQYPDQYPSHYSAQYSAPSSSRHPDQYSSPSSLHYSQASSRIPDQGGPSDGFVERPFLSATETSERIRYWNGRATKGRYDAATYIADPLAHYSWLEHLEEHVVRNSEYFQYRGDLQCEDDTLPVEVDLIQRWPTNMLASLRGMLPRYFPPSGSRVNPAELRTSHLVLESLWKSYWILCKTLRSFEKLRSEGFCRDFYSVLVHHPRRDEAKLVRIPQGSLGALKTGIENAIMRVFNGDPEGPEFVLLSFVATQCDDILENMNLLPGTSGLPVMAICRAAVLLLDLALVSYVGSHGTRFTSYIQSTVELISIRSNNRDMPPFGCGLKRLACLSEFLGDSKVWVFQKGIEEPYLTSHYEGPAGLSVVTRMEEFADIWGPVRSVLAENGTAVRQYNLSRGYIQALPRGGNVDDIIDCHWFSPSLRARQHGEEVPGMAPNALLSIGGALKKNNECHYTLDQYEDDYGLSMGQLGTMSPYWATDARTSGFSAGQYFNVTGSVTQKKLPGITLKEHILNSFSQDPVNADIEVLNKFIGVEVSHCTGNARRVRMKEVFRLERVRERLSYYYPDWELTDWGAAFSAALRNQSLNALWDLWTQDRDMRQPIGELVCHLLKLLCKTGQQDHCLVAAYFGPRDERHQEINIRGNEWAKCLRDSDKVATFAVVGDACLKYATRNNLGGLCQPTCTETMYETRISFNGDLPSQSDYIKLEPLGLVFRVEKVKRNRIMVLVPTDAQFVLRMLHPLTKSAMEVIARIGTRRSRKEFYALIKASTESYGGMTEPRHMEFPAAQQVPANQPEQQNDPRLESLTPIIREVNRTQPIPVVFPRGVVAPRRPPQQSLRDQRVRRPKEKAKGGNGKRSSKNSSSCCFL